MADTVGALDALRAEGKIREYGVGHLPLDRVREYARLGRPASVLFEMSAVARTARTGLLPFLRERGLGGIAFSPTGRGLLTGSVAPGQTFPKNDIRSLDPLFSREKLVSGLRAAEWFSEVGRRHGRTRAQVAIARVLAQPGVTMVLTGPTSPDHLTENLAAADWTYPAEELEATERLLAAEDARVREASLKAVREIAAGPLAERPEAALKDLTYAFETAVETGLVSEEEVLPLFSRLLVVHERAGSETTGPGGGEAGSGPVRQELEALRLDFARLL